MTKEQFKRDMALIAKNESDDVEMSHCHADDLLCKALREAGYGDGVGIYEKLGKWYA